MTNKVQVRVKPSVPEADGLGYIGAGFGPRQPAKPAAPQPNSNPSLGIVGVASGPKPSEISAVPPAVKATGMAGKAIKNELERTLVKAWVGAAPISRTLTATTWSASLKSREH
jgi:hypothetical protein